MAFTTHQLQGSSSTFPSVSSSWSRGCKPKLLLPAFHPVGRKDRLISLKLRSRPSGGASLVLGPKSKIFKISAFKDGSQHDDSGGRTNGSKSLKNPVKVSYLQHDREDSTVESSKVQNVVSAPYSAPDETTVRSVALRKLLKHWLRLLRTPSPVQQVETPPEQRSLETSEKPNTVQKQGGEILKAAWGNFLGLDATIKIPLLVFTPMYLAVNLVYGSEVSKELTPLWITGPVIVALYVKMFEAICGLYVFSFKQTVKVIKTVPAYSSLVFEYLLRGKIKAVLNKQLWQPIVNMDYKNFVRRHLKEWLVERYLDFIESIWPFYCRTIRFLKSANFI